MKRNFFFAILVVGIIIITSITIDYYSAKIYLPNQFESYVKNLVEILPENNKEKIGELKKQYPNISVRDNLPSEPYFGKTIILLENRAQYKSINQFDLFTRNFIERTQLSIRSDSNFENLLVDSISFHSQNEVQNFDYFNEEFQEQDFRTSICFSSEVIQEIIDQNLQVSAVVYSRETEQATLPVYVDEQVETNQQICYWFDTKILEELGDYDFYIRLYNKNDEIDVIIPVVAY